MQEGRLRGGVLSFLVDTTGAPVSIAYEHGSGTGLDKLAFEILSHEHFKPAMRDGIAVTVPLVVKFSFDACAQHKKLDRGFDASIQSLRDKPRQAIAPLSAAEAVLEFALTPEIHAPSAQPNQTGFVKAPVPLRQPVAQFSDEARRAKAEGICLVSLVVDKEGIPRNVRVTRPSGFGLDESALAAVRNYRFKPAMWNGSPVPVVLMVEVNFRLY